MQLLKTADVLSDIEKNIAKKKINLYLIEKVFEIAKAQEGQKMTKRFVTALAKLPGMDKYTIHFEKNYGMFYINIWGYDITYNEKFHSLIGYYGDGKDDTINMDKIAEHNKCYTLDAGRIEKLEKGKAKVAAWVDRWNKATAELCNINDEAGEFELEYTFYNSEAKYGKK